MLLKKKIFLLFVLVGKMAVAQVSENTVTVMVQDVNKEPVVAASVQFIGTGKSAVTNDSGRAVVQGIPANKVSLIISAVGYITINAFVHIHPEASTFTFTLKKDIVILDDVSVLGYTATQLANRQAYNVTAIDAQKLHNTTLDIAHVLNRVPGARLRVTGGVGSDFDLSLNGFSGKRIKYFVDGVPVDYLGASFQINNIPVNFAERIEVYKGVIPVWLGSDALGGAVNIITGNKYTNYLDASYSFGSLNTHRSYINAGYTSKKGWAIRLNAFQNYSDNNYKVTVDAAHIRTGQYFRDTTLKRFHDHYHNETIIAQTGVVNKKWADQLLAGVTLGKYYKEIQTGARLTTVFGALHNNGNILMPALVYKKKGFLTQGLDVSFNANYNFGEEQSVDTVHARYNWFNDSVTYRGKGGERWYSLYRYKNNSGNMAATITYQLSSRHFLALNNVYSRFNREGSNMVSPHVMLDNIPQKSNKNISGFSYQYKMEKNWDITVFSKYIRQAARTTLIETSYLRPGDTVYNKVINTIGRLGYGVAVSYFPLPGMQWKFSYENTYRLPESEDLFGDVTNKEGNWSLNPELSKNISTGFSYRKSLEEHLVYFSATGIYAGVKNYIYYVFNSYTNRLYAHNLLKVSNIGIESEIRYSYKQLLSAGINGTYQNIRDREKYRFDMSGNILSNTYKERIPNIPYLFGNADATAYFNKLFSDTGKLSIGYNLLYVHKFYLYWANEGAPSTKRFIPAQIAHDVNITYSHSNGKYNIAFEVKNITDGRLYDNYSLQKPGRSINIKLRYFIHQ